MTGKEPPAGRITRDRLRSLEEQSAALEPAGDARRTATAQMTAFADNFLERLPGMDAFEPEQGFSSRLEAPFGESATELPALLEQLDAAIFHEGINPASGGHLGYIPGGGVYPAALGDYLAAVCNRYSGVAFASPGAARLEQGLVRWMCELVGYPAESGGDLTSGGSVANLSAIITAREAMKVKARDVGRGCIYLTEDVHHCVDKALRAAGLADSRKRLVPMDERYRMDVAALEEMIARDKYDGLRPWLLVASAGTTDSGAIDPIEALADIADEHGLWLHVDAAYGGFFLLCDEGRQVLRGLHRSHSIVLDPHKGLFLPYGSGAVLVRNQHWLAGAHAYQADYMQDAAAGEAGYSPADLSLELTRPFRGLRFWLPLKLFGLAPFRAALAEKIWLARYFHEQLSAAPGWELGPVPELSVVTYRYLPRHGDANAFNRRLV
ncbi:MAG: aminotransferase class I/II-fold pyridoxal phosphate-dependent enzyme, partial [Lysobacterales bacterium]